MLVTELLAIGTIVIQIGIIGIAFEAVRRRDVSAAVNALVSFAITLLPRMIEVISPAILGELVTFGPELPLWLALAGLLHSFGMLGPYDTIWWWDSLTHTISAALVAALVYGGLIVVTDHSIPGDLPAWFVPALTILFTLVAGIFWELIELVAREIGEHFDIEPVLVHYGLRDTALDLVFDLVGALLVVVVDLRFIVPVAEQFPQLTTTLVLASGGIVVGGSIVLGGLISVSIYHRPSSR